MIIESIPMQGITNVRVRAALDVLQRNIQALAGDTGFATKEDLAVLRRLVNTNTAQPSTTRTIIKEPLETPTPGTETPEIPTVSGAAGEIWTLEVSPPNTDWDGLLPITGDGLPASLQVINQSPGMSSSVNAVTGTGGSPLNFAQINIVGSYVYPSASENLGFGGFLNFITRNMAGTPIQGAFINGGLVGTGAGVERGDLDFGIYGHRVGLADGAGGGNIPRLIALRSDGGQLALKVDADDEWDLGTQPDRWQNGFFSKLVQCGGVDLRYNGTNGWALAVANSSSMLDGSAIGAHPAFVAWLKILLNTTTAYIPIYT